MAILREAQKQDWDAIWPIFHEIVETGETYPYERDTTKQQGEIIWLQIPEKTVVIEEDGEILGTYYLKPNTTGQGSHVCNCGYMVAAKARSRGLATLLCEHSQQLARELGYKAMQFNLVVTTNTVSAHLWSKLGFDTVGRLPGAFKHPTKGFVDALVMYKILD